MRYLAALVWVWSVLMPLQAHAKRTPAPVVEPVLHAGRRYTVPNDDGRRGYLQVWDVKTGKLLGEITVFRNPINPFLEEDVQWVFIKKLSIQGRHLIVWDERDRS